MNDLTFCPKCGNQSLQWNGVQKWTCSVCDYVLYHNTAAAVAVIIRCADEILFTRRNQEPQKGFLDLAGGFVDPKESGEQACGRELFEEMKITVDPTQLIYLDSLPNVYEYKNISYNTLDLFYEYPVSEKLELQLEISEISEIIWLKKEDINLEDLAFDSQKNFFKEYLKSS